MALGRPQVLKAVGGERERISIRHRVDDEIGIDRLLVLGRLRMGSHSNTRCCCKPTVIQLLGQISGDSSFLRISNRLRIKTQVAFASIVNFQCTPVVCLVQLGFGFFDCRNLSCFFSLVAVKVTLKSPSCIIFRRNATHCISPDAIVVCVCVCVSVCRCACRVCGRQENGFR